MTDATLELSVERLIDAPVAAVWRAWTDHLAEWWCPAPWTTEVIEVDLRAGGRFATVMRGPDGEESPVEGLLLEVSRERRIVFTDAFRAGWLPQPPFMTGVFDFALEGDGTRYRAAARHWTAEAMERHRAMGFEQGWGTAAAQLETVALRVK